MDIPVSPQPLVGRLPFRRPVLKRVSPGLLASVVALGAGALPAAAQQASEPPGRLPTISVEGQRPNDPATDYKVDQSASPKFTAPLLDTPKTVTVIPQALIEERGATSLSEVLRTTPGISLGSGEGGVSVGDRPFIRGFDAMSSTYIDGVRDPGGQSREIFNLEQVEITKGPSSTYGGRGTTGGSLNLVSKTAKAENFSRGSVTLGSDMTKRATADVNRVIDGIGLRLNAMVHDSEVAGRDEVEITKYGFAPTITFGLQKPTQLTLSYYHLRTDEIPDYGHPFDFRTGKPVAVDRDNFYGLLSRDFRETSADIGTVQFQHEFESVLLRNTTRYGVTENKYIATKPNLPASGTYDPDQVGPVNGPLGAEPVPGGFMVREVRSRNSDTKTLANVTDLSGEFQTGFLGHSWLAGLEFSREESANRGYVFSPRSSILGDLYNPNPNDAFSSAQSPATAFSISEIVTKSAYIFDTLKFSPQWELTLGLRFDDYDQEAVSGAATGVRTPLQNDSNFVNYQTGLVYKPLPNGSIYAAYGTSSNPSGGAGTEGSDDGNLGATNDSLKPEENRSYELGSKWDLLNNRLSLSGAVFRIEKTNARVSGPTNTSENLLVGEQRVDGFEIGFAGALSERWKVFGGYTFLDSEIVDDGPFANNQGKEFPLIPNHSLSLWTTYDVTKDWTVGGGAFYSGARYANPANTAKLPDYWRLDAMVAYDLTESVDLQLNILNLLDESIYDAGYQGQFATLAPGRTALLTTNFKF